MSELWAIGELARRTGLTVKAIRFYADRGIVPPTSRNATGHRLYDEAAAARLDLVRTLRDLGLDLGTIRRVLDHEVSLPGVAAAHVRAIDAQIRTLRLRRSVLTVVARGGSGPEEMTKMHDLAAYERGRLIEDFLATVFQDVEDRPRYEGISRSMTPELPDEPSPAQLDAWVELAALAADPEFRTMMRELTNAHSAGTAPLRPDPAARLRSRVGPLLGSVDPGSAEARTVAGEFQVHFDYLRMVADPRRRRYFELLSLINGWPVDDSLTPALDWYLAAAG